MEEYFCYMLECKLEKICPKMDNDYQKIFFMLPLFSLDLRVRNVVINNFHD